MKPFRRALALAGGACLLLAGCAGWNPPQPWEKGDLARPGMQMDQDPLATRLREHTYFSREAASGGSGVGGGGCGCN